MSGKIRVELEYNATEIHCFPKKRIVTNNFTLNPEAMKISFCNMNEDVVHFSEMSKEDAIRLAKSILNNYK